MAKSDFHIPVQNGKEIIYFSGNSLGLQPKSAEEYIQVELDAWKTYAVEGHFEGKNPWLHYHELFQKPLSTLTGALETEVVAMNSLTVNLNLLLISFFRPSKDSNFILTEPQIFPSDKYALDSHLTYHGLSPEHLLTPSFDEQGYIDTNDWIEIIEQYQDKINLILISGVNYLTGQVYDIEAITKHAKQYNITVGVDLAHAIGNISLDLHRWEIDFAVWCSYKYLNSGAGGVGGAYVHEKHHQSNLPRLHGWWSNDVSNRFEMKSGITPWPTVDAWQMSNANVLSLAAQKASLDLFERVTWPSVLEENNRLKILAYDHLNDIHPDIQIISPANIHERGCQLSIFIPNVRKDFVSTLRKNGVISDWRNFKTGGIIRIAPVGLYNTQEDIISFKKILLNTYHEYIR